MIESPAAVMATLCGVAAFWFWITKATGWKLFRYLVPLIWIYATPVALRNTGVLPAESSAYDVLGQYALPAIIVLLLLSVDVGSAVRIMGRGVLVMLMGTAGVMVGAVVASLVVGRWLGPMGWSAFGALAGSWIGGTGNMAAAAYALGTPAEEFGLAVLADNAIYVVWLPLLLGSKAFADRFNRWARVPEDRVARMEAAAAEHAVEKRPPTQPQLLYLAFLAAAAVWFAAWLAPRLPPVELGGETVISASTWVVLIVTTLGILLSRTPARRLPASHELAMALLYVFVARMGATASLSGFAQAPAFLLGAFIWIAVHGLFCVGAAWLLKVDLHTVAIASAANIGGAASSPVVAAHHRESLVPAAILMALVGYAVGNYLAILTGYLCRLVA